MQGEEDHLTPVTSAFASADLVRLMSCRTCLGNLNLSNCRSMGENALGVLTSLLHRGGCLAQHWFNSLTLTCLET